MTDTQDIRPPEGSSPSEYSNWVLPWGETVRQAEARIGRAGRIEDYNDRIYHVRKVRGCHLSEARFVELHQWPPGTEVADPAVLAAATDLEFVEKCREGLRIRKLNRRRGIDEEIAWIAANMHRDLPDLQSAPNHAAISWLIDVRQNDKVRAQFWSVYQSKRLSPGDKKPKETAFKEDVVDAAAADEESHRDEVVRRLWGKDD